MPIARGNGAAVAYRDEGSGPAVVLLHGAGLTHRLWDPQIDHLRASFRCIAPDLRGHGATRVDAPGDVYSAADHAADVVALLDVLGLEAAHLVGLSLGGLVSMELAVRSPERVRSLATIGAPAGIDTGPAIRTLLALSTRYLFRRLASGGMTWVAETGARRMTRDPEVRRYMIEDCAPNEAEEFRRVWRGVVAFDARARLGTVAAPTLVIVGSKDRNRRGARLASELIPGARLEIVPDAGHITNRERPAEINARLQGWLEEHSAEQIQRR